jgi:mannose-6-phosphate isomerase-like protein (cupin superfamily)
MIESKNLKDMVNSTTELFSYLKVGQLNSHMLNVLQAENRTLDFHVHEQSDEMFYCIEGEFDIEFDGGITHLREGDFVIIPKGISHRPICKGLVKCLLIEKEGTLKNENTGGTYSEYSDLIANIGKIHTTELGMARIKKNLKLESDDIVSWCVQRIERADSIIHKGKNWYVYADSAVITINARSYTVITAHRRKTE